MSDRETKEADLQSFFAQPRRALYIGGAGVVLLGVVVLLLLTSLDEYGAWAIVPAPALCTLVVIVLSRSSVGRGCLWTIGRGKSPTAQIVIGLLVTAACCALALVHTGRRAHSSAPATAPGHAELASTTQGSAEPPT